MKKKFGDFDKLDDGEDDVDEHTPIRVNPAAAYTTASTSALRLPLKAQPAAPVLRRPNCIAEKALSETQG